MPDDIYRDSRAEWAVNEKVTESDSTFDRRQCARQSQKHMFSYQHADLAESSETVNLQEENVTI